MNFRLIILCAILPMFALAASDDNFKIQPIMIKEGVLLKSNADMAIAGETIFSTSVPHIVPFNKMFLRRKNGPKEYFWFAGSVNFENFKKLHAFSLADNYLKFSDVVQLRFYATKTTRAFQDESDIYFDNAYIYSFRVPTLFYKKNGFWQKLKESKSPSIVIIDSTIAGLNTYMSAVSEEPLAYGKHIVRPETYIVSFSAENYLPYVSLVSAVSGSEINITPNLIQLDSVAKNNATTSITLENVAATNRLESLEILYDSLSSEVFQNVAKVDSNDFLKLYPQKFSFEDQRLDSNFYKIYEQRYLIKRTEAFYMWRFNKMGTAAVVNKAIRAKMDSLQMLPLQVSLVPIKIEAIYENDSTSVISKDSVVAKIDSIADSTKVADSVAVVDSIAAADSVIVTLPVVAESTAVIVPDSTKVADSVIIALPVVAESTVTDSMAVSAVVDSSLAVPVKIKAIKFTFKEENSRYDVAWISVANSSVDSLYAALKSANAVRALITLKTNKPVWIYDEGELKSRNHYRYEKLELSIDNKAFEVYGNFVLPEYILAQTEVKNWLEHSDEIPQPKKIIQADIPENFKKETPRVITDNVKGTVALIDSGTFRYKGRVVKMSAFAIHTTEVSQGFFKATMARLDSNDKLKDKSNFKGETLPVHNINWDNSRSFCKAIGGDLPTEAQWEFAARAGHDEGLLWNLDKDPFPSKYAVFRSNSYSMGKKDKAYGPQAVTSKVPNEWGIFNMSGNVAEWTRDNHFALSFWVESKDPTGALLGSSKVFKGGSWKDYEKDLNLMSSDNEDPRYWSDRIGFRCVFSQDSIGVK